MGSFVAESRPIESLEFFHGGELRGRDIGTVQEGPEARNDVADKLTQLMERWKDSISLTNRRLDERFLTGEIHLIIRFWIADTGEEWFVCAERYAADNNVFSNRQNEAVFVGIVELVQQPERFVPTLVRFERVDSFYRFPLHTLYLSSSPLGFITDRAMRDRKLDHFPRLSSNLPLVGADHDKVKSQMVECAPEVMDSIADDRGNVGLVDIERAKMKEWISGFHIRVTPNSLSVKHAGAQNEIFQFSDMLIGPFNFYADQADSVVGVHEFRL